MKECCIDGCDQPGTVHANYEEASLYCEKHGVCGYCGDSVKYFVHVEDLKCWIFPCVAAMRFVDIQRQAYVSPESDEEAKKSFIDYWSKSA